MNLRINDQIDQETFAAKHTELRDRLTGMKLQLDALDRSHDENAELASKIFELSQTLKEQWLNADYAAKRRILEIVFLNCRLSDATLISQIRKPFDVLAEGLLVPQSGGSRTPAELFAAGVQAWSQAEISLVSVFSATTG